MRLTPLGNPNIRTALAAACLALAGCQRLPYIDQAKTVPKSGLSPAAELDREVEQANFLTRLPDAVALPDVDPPRTPDNPDAMEVWPMTLQEAIQIGLDNSEVIRVISLGAQGIPIGGFEPTPLSTAAGAALGAGTLASVYDPAIQETQIAEALSVFDAQLTTRLFYEKREQLTNNSIAAGFFQTGDRFPALIRTEGSQAGTPNFESRIQKRAATGGTYAVAHQIEYLYSNFPSNTFPSAYNTRTVLTFSQPLLGGSQQFGPSGLEANRAPIIVARLNSDVSVWRFKTEIMAMVRSIEQQYWALSQQQVQYWSRQQAVQLGEAILQREQAKLQVGSGSVPNVAEAEQQLRNFQIDYVQSTADLINVERQLRNILGLKPSDNRRIVPTTAPTEARLVPDWDTSFAQMIAFQPDIVQNQMLVRIAELQLLITRNQLLPALNFDALYQFNGFGQRLDEAEAVGTGASVRAIDPIVSQMQQNAGLNPTPGTFKNFTNWQVGLTFQMPLGFRRELANTRASQYTLLRQRAFLQQVVHQSTHSLQRFFLEVDANYKLLKYAGLAREAAEKRLAAQRSFFEAGTINIDRYLDAVNQWANAVAREAQFKTSYNTSIAALEESKGTLLAYNNIAVNEGPQPRKAYIQAIDQRAAHQRLPVPLDGPQLPQRRLGPPNADSVVPMPTPDGDDPGPRPPMPAPVGPLGPPPRPVAPTIPAADPTPLSAAPVFGADPGLVRASAPEPELPMLPPAAAEPTLSVPIALPPLPPE